MVLMPDGTHVSAEVTLENKDIGFLELGQDLTIQLETRKDIKLAPSMNLTAEIKTGQRRVIEYLLSPIQKAGNESLRER
ncbi:hypothetical protein [Paracidovorax avenae]|uniref:hypothetical protein n=1 Tax=Paracidovorax avenae TaxID=80867 RepID=UPI000A5DB6ED|nr:hypothetical protein [Paracidovorax avenae]